CSRMRRVPVSTFFPTRRSSDLAMDEGLVARSTQARMADPESGLVLDDVTRILGCYKALTKVDIAADLGADTQPMRRALAFCRDIDRKSTRLNSSHVKISYAVFC